GAKIDFFDHEARELIDLYEALLQKAAEYYVMVVFHGANKPTSRARTWPNEMPDSEIGELAYARRKGNTWLLAIMNGPQPKTLHVPMSFLTEGEYKAATVRDNPTDDARVEMENTIRKRTDSL